MTLLSRPHPIFGMLGIGPLGGARGPIPYPAPPSVRITISRPVYLPSGKVAGQQHAQVVGPYLLVTSDDPKQRKPYRRTEPGAVRGISRKHRLAARRAAMTRGVP